MSFSSLATSMPPPLQHLFLSPESGVSRRDSPRTRVVSEQLLKFHLETPRIDPESLSTPTLDSPQEPTSFPSDSSSMAVDSPSSTPPYDPLFATSPKKRLRRSGSPPLSTLEECDMIEITDFRSSRSRSPPPPSQNSDSEDDLGMRESIKVPDELTRYLRKKKRTEQIVQYKRRELQHDRETRVRRRNNPLSQTRDEVAKTSKKVKFSM
jgi:hypothetical protein